uniref:Magnesium transporter MRS2/LPE10 n=1 Tax=Tanacetum cinerariifolium TaxID=118510 RepID=A0A6L2NZH4_TANCI|nr:magnesium transporter MRS2/LPE10 [Tanacetum cinerariifolium]
MNVQKTIEQTWVKPLLPVVSDAKDHLRRGNEKYGDEKHVDSDIGRIPSPGLRFAIQILPMGKSALISGDGWTSALVEVHVIIETLAHGLPRTQAAPRELWQTTECLDLRF